MVDRLLIAKSGVNSNEWLPLWMHLKDTAGVMGKLLDEYVSDSFASSCGLNRDVLKQAAVFIAYMHDIGKATTAFQCKISRNVSERIGELEKQGMKLEISGDKFQHALAGETILRYYGCPETVAAVVGAHHGVPSELAELRVHDLSRSKKDIVGYEDFFGQNDSNKPVLLNAWDRLIQEALSEAKLSTIKELPELSSKAQMLLSGLLIMADWIASDIKIFPLISAEDTGNEAWYPKRTEIAWENIGFTEMWRPNKSSYRDEDFKKSFGFSPRETQRAMLDIVASSDDPGILILEAPMGIGKSEAALASAELLASKANKNGLFFGLPTQSTANGLFPRIMQWAENQSKEFYHSIQLRHGSSALNKVFVNIHKGIPEEETDSGLIVHSWFCESKRACLDEFVVATVDQMLMSALKRRHVMLLHLGLSQKVVVIDEVHAYDAYMNQYLERALQWLGAYHTPVILLSATLPSKRRMSLIRAYLQQSSSNSAFEENEAYPLLTWTDGNEIRQKALAYVGIHRTVGVRKCCSDDLITIVKEAVQSGGCVGIIVNTVSRAQRISDMVRREITDNALLYHAQYIMPDRNIKENELLERIGKNSCAGIRRGFVVIGTQVLEQSLDIDVDVLITDICPMDLLLQRIGRLHRHERDHRPDKLKEAVCYVVRDEYDNNNTGTKQIYGEWLLKETLELLPKTITLPDDISPLVQKVYRAFDDSEEYRKFENDTRRAQSRAMSFLMKKPKTKDIHGMLDRSIDGNDEMAEASVRDGISSIEVLVMQRKQDGEICFIDGTPLSSELSGDECERIAEQRLRLPSRFCQRWNIEKTVRELENQCRAYISNWQRSPLLKGKNVLFLDENMETGLLEYRLKYSYENGLTYERECDENE